MLAAMLLSGSLLCAAPAAADKAFGGDDAAYIDWAWKNCEMVSTKKQHDLVDQARNKGNDAFQRSYEQQYVKIVAANPTPAEARRTCELVKNWYGRDGDRISELVQIKTEKPTAPGTNVGSRSPASGAKGGGGGSKRGGGF